MIKYIIFIVLIYIIYLFFFKKKSNKSKTNKKEISETMVECAKCNIYLSAKETIIKNGKFYCSKECAKD